MILHGGVWVTSVVLHIAKVGSDLNSAGDNLHSLTSSKDISHFGSAQCTVIEFGQTCFKPLIANMLLVLFYFTSV